MIANVLAACGSFCCWTNQIPNINFHFLGDIFNILVDAHWCTCWPHSGTFLRHLEGQRLQSTHQGDEWVQLLRCLGKCPLLIPERHWMVSIISFLQQVQINQIMLPAGLHWKDSHYLCIGKYQCIPRDSSWMSDMAYLWQVPASSSRLKGDETPYHMGWVYNRPTSDKSRRENACRCWFLYFQVMMDMQVLCYNVRRDAAILLFKYKSGQHFFSCLGCSYSKQVWAMFSCSQRYQCSSIWVYFSTTNLSTSLSRIASLCIASYQWQEAAITFTETYARARALYTGYIVCPLP